MSTPIVVDASVVVKWIVSEADSADALQVRDLYTPIAPELAIAECANILWKKVQRGNLTTEQAAFAAELVDRLAIEIVPMRSLVKPALELSVRLVHPAYDCIYVALAKRRDCRFVTADESFCRKVNQLPGSGQVGRCVTLAEAIRPS